MKSTRPSGLPIKSKGFDDSVQSGKMRKKNYGQYQI